VAFINLRLPRPTLDDTQNRTWNNLQKALRSIVEVVVGYVKNWGAASIVFKESPELQEFALMIIYNMAQMNLLEYPIRTLEQIFHLLKN